MNKFYFLLVFFTFSLVAKPEKVTPTDFEIYFWGGSILAFSLGLLLLLVTVLSKIFKTEDEVENKSNFKASSLFGWFNKNKPAKESENSKQSKDVKEKEKTKSKTSSKSKPVETTNSTSSPKQKTEKFLDTNNTTSTGECKFIDMQQIFDLKSLELDTVCKEFLSKMSSAVSSQTMSIYFYRENVFCSYMEKSGSLIIKHESEHHKDITEDIISNLLRRQGAFTQNKKEAVMPLVNNYSLFGAVKFQFEEPISDFNVTNVWNEVKFFSRNIYQTINYQFAIHDEETFLYNSDHFNNILNYRTNLNIPQNLTLFRIFKYDHLSKTLKTLAESVQTVMDKKVEIFRINEETIGMFLSIEDREKLSKSLKEILVDLKKLTMTSEICVGSADYHSSLSQGKWFDKAMYTLNDAIAAGPNNYRLYKID